MPRVAANGVKLYYEVHGSGAPVLGIHGTPSSALLWEDAAEVLGRSSRCIIYDRRGFCRSERPEPFEAVNLNDNVEDAAALREALSAAPAVVIGRSTGGEIALELARSHPGKVAALVLLEPALFTPGPPGCGMGTAPAPGSARRGRREPFGFRDRAQGSAGRRGLGGALRPAASALHRREPGSAGRNQGPGLGLSEAPLELSKAEAANIRQPTLIITAEGSPEALHAVNRRLAELLPNTETALVAGGHLIDPAGPTVLDFLHRHLPP